MKSFIPKTLNGSFKYINIRELGIEEFKECNFMNKKENRDNERVGIILPNQREERWKRDKAAMEKEGKIRDISLIFEYNDFEMEKQIEAINKLILDEVDVLIICPINGEGEPEAIEKAKKKGIKVISFDLLAMNSDIDLFVSFNLMRVGELQGKYLIGKVPRGNYIILLGEPNGEVFLEGAMEYIMPLVYTGNIKIITQEKVERWIPDYAYNIVKNSLIRYGNNIDAVLAPNDAIAGAVIQAIDEENLAGKVAVTGQDADISAIRRIIEGTQSMTVLKDTNELAWVAINAAIKLIKGEQKITYKSINNGKIDVPSILTNPILVDKNNVYSILNETGYYKNYIL
ncbi:sugar ABC transporter substrate-binding protein [Clostridium intestinale]|uniref:Monosaccharide-transporting ATPase n=1 Tax=Clostridium intestinale URNW TaxID=1294142 RepID=U2PW30_9CLOT|nr:substrate-binding domain-containing protein [Clostridium intestinale]ERK30645.1 monosaccharide-transporting ATPase [Clostridium intestinale URNW]